MEQQKHIQAVRFSNTVWKNAHKEGNYKSASRPHILQEMNMTNCIKLPYQLKNNRTFVLKQY